MELAFKILSLVTALLPLLTQIMKTVETIFGKGTGDVKKESVKATVLDALAQDPIAQQVPAEVLDSVVDRLIDRHAKALKATGQLEPI